MDTTLVLIIRTRERHPELLLGLKKSKIGAGTLMAPGGKCHKREPPRTCAIREVKEEVGIVLDPTELQLIAVVTIHEGGVAVRTIHVFRTEYWRSEPSPSSELGEPNTGWWYDTELLPFEKMLPDTHYWLPHAIDGRDPFCARIYYANKKLKGVYISLPQTKECA